MRWSLPEVTRRFRFLALNRNGAFFYGQCMVLEAKTRFYKAKSRIGSVQMTFQQRWKPIFNSFEFIARAF